MYSIGHFIDYIGYAHGGAEINVEGLCRNNNNSDYNFEIVTSKSPFTKPDFSNLRVPIRTSLGLCQVREASFLYKGVISDLFYRLPGRIYTHFAKKYLDDFGLIHCHSLDILNCINQRGKTKPVIITLYNPLPKRFINIISCVDSIIARSHQVMEDLIQKNPLLKPKIFYIPPGCEFNYYIPKGNNENITTDYLIDKAEIKVLFIGRFRPFKNLENLLIAMEIIKNKPSLPKYSLTVVGDGPCREKIFRLAKKLSIMDSIHFVGTFQAGAMGRVYQEHDIVIVPSFYESFSQVSLEALVAQKRLVISEELKEFHKIFPAIPTCNPRDPFDIANKIIHTSKLPKYLVSPLELKRFTWSEIMKKHYALYSAILSEYKINSFPRA